MLVHHVKDLDENSCFHGRSDSLLVRATSSATGNREVEVGRQAPFELLTRVLGRLQDRIEHQISIPTSKKKELLTRYFVELYGACHEGSILHPQRSMQLYEDYGGSLRKCLAQAIPRRKHESENGRRKLDAVQVAAAQYAELESYGMYLLTRMPPHLFEDAHSWPGIADLVNDTFKEYIVEGCKLELSLSVIKHMQNANICQARLEHANFINRCQNYLIPNMRNLFQNSRSESGVDVPSLFRISEGGHELFFSSDDDNSEGEESLPQNERYMDHSLSDASIYGREIPTDDTCYVLTTKMTWKIPQNKRFLKYATAFIAENLSLSLSEIARRFYDKCANDGKTLYGSKKNKGHRPKFNLDWMDMLFVPMDRKDAIEALLSPFRKIRKKIGDVGL